MDTVRISFLASAGRALSADSGPRCIGRGSVRGGFAADQGRRPRRQSAFTLAEVLAALLLMAVLIPVTMQGVSVASRAGMLGQRKAAAMRIAERVLDEQIVSGQVALATPYGNVVDGDTTYPWTMTSEAWTEDAMTVLTVRVSFDVQGHTYEVAASTLYDPAAVPAATATVASTP